MYAYVYVHVYRHIIQTTHRFCATTHIFVLASLYDIDQHVFHSTFIRLVMRFDSISAAISMLSDTYIDIRARGSVCVWVCVFVQPETGLNICIIVCMFVCDPDSYFVIYDIDIGVSHACMLEEFYRLA